MCFCPLSSTSHSSQHTPPTKNGMKSQLPPFCPPPLTEKREEKLPTPPLFFAHLDFEINAPPPGAFGTISTLKMSHMLEILISGLVLIVN